MIGFESDEIILQKLRERLRSMTDEELIEFGKSVRELASPSVAATANPFQQQLEEARAEWKRRKNLQMKNPAKNVCWKRTCVAQADRLDRLRMLDICHFRGRVSRGHQQPPLSSALRFPSQSPSPVNHKLYFHALRSTA